MTNRLLMMLRAEGFEVETLPGEDDLIVMSPLDRLLETSAGQDESSS
ncbi:hypothetical protein GRZ55_11160 [Chelativorans sp. ZYF759]|nr:hypothetical protein [Chelativorans sp. ZYF759]NMG39802.1 hypothetical protein [Chelativorans sp. ZYF759]